MILISSAVIKLFTQQFKKPYVLKVAHFDCVLAAIITLIGTVVLIWISFAFMQYVPETVC